MTTSALLLALLLSGSDLTGTSVMPVLRVGQGPRATAMGEAFVALSDDASALHWNPAGLGQIPDYHLAFSHQQWFARTHDEVIHAVLPGPRGALGLGLLYSGEPGIEYWDEHNLPGDTFSTWNGLLDVGYGTELLPGWCFGIGVKGFYQSLRRAMGYGGCVDVGFVGRPLPSLRLGLAGRNVGKAWYGDLADLPTEVGFGIAWTEARVNATADVVYPLDNEVNFRAGLEFLPVKELALRLGYRTGPADVTSLGWLSGLSAGVGLSVGRFGVDYTLAPYGPLGITHRIGVRVLVPRRGAGSLRIRTLDGQTMLPVRADVTLWGVTDTSGQTDRRGDMYVDDLRPGQLVIRTALSGYVQRLDTMLILGDREQSAVIDLQPLRYGGLHGGLYDAATRQHIGGTVSYRGPVSGEQTVEPNVGTWALRSLPAGVYVLTASGPTPEYVAQSCTARVEPAGLTERSFYLVKHRQAIVLDGVNFETGRAEILPQFHAALDRAGRILVDNPSIVVELAGHTDPREIATAEYPSNWELSQARANAVRDYLINRFGVSADRLVARGYADTQPVASNETEAGMAQNRRTEFRILEQ